MFSNAANIKPWFALPLLLSLPIGWVLRNIEPSRTEIHGGPMMLPVWFDGLRPVVAGGCWLRANLAWEKRDEPATLAWLELTVAADERPAYFWLNGARMIAYDLPDWRPRGSVARNEAYARRALGFLETGRRRHGEDPALLIEMANIHLRRRGDLAKAAIYYRLAAEQPGAPYYAARIHAELLQALGRPDEALAWLRQVLPTLPANEPAARRAVVEARIRTLDAMTRR